MNHSFDIENAKKYGVIEAIILENILHWLAVNKANESNIRDEKVWTYNSVTAFARLFPYLSPKQIRRAMDSLVDQKAIVKGEYNKARYDKTSWYSIPDESILAIGPKGQMDMPKRANRFDQKGKPIPDINTNINTSVSMLPSTFEHSSKSKNKDKAKKEIIISEDTQRVLDTIKEHGKQDLKKSKAARDKIGKLLDTYTADEVCGAYAQFAREPYWIERDLAIAGFVSQFERYDVKAQRMTLNSKSGWHTPQTTDTTPADLSGLDKMLAAM